MMNRLLDYLSNNAHTAISLPTVMCFVQFVYDLIDIFKSGHFDSAAFGQLVSSANGFETVVLCMIMMALKKKTK